MFLRSLSLLGLALTIALGGCRQPNSDKIRVGVILPLSGAVAPFGRKIEKGIRLAMAEATKANAGLQLELIVEDDKGQTAQAVSAFKKLSSIDDIKIIIGTLTSSGTLAMAPLTKDAGVLLMSPSASSPDITTAGPLVYRVWSSDLLDGVVTAEYCYNELKLRKMAISYQNNDYCVGLQRVFTETFEALGGVVVEKAGYNEGERDFRATITKLKAAGIDGVYLPGHPIGISSFLKQSLELGLAVKCMSNVAVEDASFLELAGNASDSLYYTAPAFDLGSNEPVVQDFVKVFESAYHEEPDIFSVKGYESLAIMLQAFVAGSRTPTEVSAFIDSTKTFKSIEGNLIFDNNGDVRTAVSVKRYVRGKSETVRTIPPQ